MTICVWCDESLTFDARKGWTHTATGELYAGSCHCVGHPHRALGRRGMPDFCPTWRDDHAALARRSE